ncbi:MAG: urea ABC transporter substrate-binding protein [Coleofasciculaceae cyanobacterium]
MPSVQVGILHSLSGTMAISEASLVDAELMAIAQINQTGGVLGKLIEPVIEDGASSPAQFERKAKLLISSGINNIFGCWTSATRKAVKPVLEELNALLWYPVQYEGLECSPNIFYTGCCPNQQVEPAVTWLRQNNKTRFYLLGSDYVFPRTANKLIKAQLKQQGSQEQEAIVVGEEYVSLGVQDFTEAIAKIQLSQADVIFNTLNGDSNLAFYRQFKDAGITASTLPIMAVSVAEAELQRLGDAAVGHYACWTYFQSLDTPNNRTFVENFQLRYGKSRVTSDPIEAAYSQVYLWKQAVEKAQSFEVDQVRLAAYGQSFEAPGGLVRIEKNHNVWKESKIGKILPNGQFEIVFCSDDLIKPLPWLGVEEVEFSRSTVVMDMLAEVTQEIQYSWKLEQKSFELEAATAQLQTEIAERKQTEIVLQKAKEAAEVANRAKSELLSKMSHELRTPLNAILGFTQVLTRDNSLNWEQQEHLEVINRSGEHLLNLINDVLDMTKIESGRTSFNETSFDLYSLLDSLEEMLQLKAKSKGLQLIFKRLSDVPQYVQTDQGKLRQVLINLLGNALKFTQEGSVILRVSLLEPEQINHQIEDSSTTSSIEFMKIQLEVEDTGFGIAPGEMHSLFEAFVQTESGRKCQEGTGLGLSISQQFIELMGGKITVNSILNQGTTFKVEIPIKLAATVDIEAQQPQQKVIGLEPGQPLYRILVVEDRWENSQLLIKLLTPLGFEVRAAENGLEGVALWKSWEPDLIWMDMRMPVMDGYEATKQIKSQLKGQATVIIALTASALEEERSIILSAGCDDFMRKPFQVSVLFEKLAQHLGVRYIYEPISFNLPLLKANSEELTTDSLTIMSEQWQQELYQAALSAHAKLIFQLIRQIPEQNQALASALTDLVNNFQFAQIIDLIQKLSYEKQ